MTADGHIFISYARQDGRDLAARLDTDLRAAGFSTWRDTRDIDPNQDFSAELERAIAASTHVVCCITPDTRRDDSFVRREVGYALAVKKPVVPLIFGDTLPPIQIVNVTRVDFSRASWQRALDDLRARLRGVPETPAPPTAPDDPYRDYLNDLYQQIVRYLNMTVFSLVSLRGEAAPDAVEAPRSALPMAFFEMAGLDDTHAGQTRFKDFHEAFEQYDGRVLLLGEPGAGKTTTLFAFARDAVAKRLADSSQPLPILAPIATWDAAKQTPLADWLTSTVPALKRDDIARLIDSGRALLLLDGLDELGGERTDPLTEDTYDPRLRFMAHLQTASLNTSAVVSCRVKDYAETGSKIALKGAVTLQPLNDEQMRDYLREMPDLWAALEQDDALREVARTPLLLSLFTFAFRDLPEEARALRDLTRGDLRDKIFETYVRRRYEREVRKPNAKMLFTLEEIYEVLGYIAVNTLVSSTNIDFSTVEVDLIDLCVFLHLLVQVSNNNHTNEYDDWVNNLGLSGVGLQADGSFSLDQNLFRFSHLLLRDYFAYRYSILKLENERADRSDLINAIKVIETFKDERSLQSLISVSSHKDRLVRLSCIVALWNFLDEAATDTLIYALSDSDATVRAHAASGLRKTHDEKAVKALINAVQDDDKYVKRNAIEALGNIGNSEAIPALSAMLGDTDEVIRRNATMALAKIGEPASKILIKLLADKNLIVRSNAALALGEMEAQIATDALIACLEDDEWRVRRSAVHALGRLQNPKAIEGLIIALSDYSEDVRDYVIKELAASKSLALPLLISAISSSEFIVRKNAVLALGYIGDKSIIELIAVLLEDKHPHVVFATAEALGNLGDQRGLGYLVNAFQESDWQARVRVLHVLSKSNDRSAVSCVIQALQDQNLNVRVTALEVIKKMGNAPIRELVGLLRSGDFDLSLTASEALVRIGTPEALAAVEAWRKGQADDT